MPPPWPPPAKRRRAQHYPQGALYVVATPIGNLADISLRALHVLQLADAVACEDTRHTQALLRAYGIDKPARSCWPCTSTTRRKRRRQVMRRLQQGQRVAYASDAGTPAVSDPGARLVAAVREAGCAVVPLPGASSVTAPLSVAGAGATRAALSSPASCRPRRGSATAAVAGVGARGPRRSCCWKRRIASRRWPTRSRRWARAR